MPYRSANFKNSMKNRVTQSVRFFVYKNVLYIKFSRNKKCHAYCIYINANFRNFMKNRGTYCVGLFVNKNITQIVLFFEKCLALYIYIYKSLAVIFAFCLNTNSRIVFC